MAKPTFVNEATATAGSPDKMVVTYTPGVDNTMLLAIYLQDGNASVSQIFDDQGNDVFLNPINKWQNLGTVNLGTTRLELWGCLQVVQPPTLTTVLLTNGQTVFDANVLEYSNVSSFGLSGSVSNTGYSNLFFQGTAQNNTDILVAVFGLPVGSGFSGNGTYNIPGQPNFPITPATFRASSGGWGGQLQCLEQTVINNPQLLIAELGLANVAIAGIMAIGVVLQGGFALQTPPGFSDIDETLLTAGAVVHSLKLNQIAQNASLGMVRPEFFYGTYLNGDTVIEPVSPVDQYQYSRDELIYIYTPYTTFDAQSGWTSASGILFYCLWDVDPVTGVVTIKEFYHPDGNTPTNQTNDGQLIVLTIGQRGMSGTGQSGVKMSNPPSLANVDLTLCGEDKPLTQTLMQTLAKNSKFAAVKAEVFYMGEFIDGQVVPAPISYVDGYVYNYSECKFLSSWLWNCNPNAFGPPPMATADGGDSHGGWSQLNYMQAEVDANGSVTCDVHFYNNRDINPDTPSNGNLPYGRLRVFCFCQRNKGPYLGGLALDVATNSLTGPASFVAEVTGLEGSATGSLTVSVPAPSGGSLVIDKIVIKRTLTGSNTVIDTTTLDSGATVPAGTTYVTTPVTFTLDAAHDYYVVVVISSGKAMFTTKAGKLTSGSIITYNQIASDVSGATTVSGMSLTADATNWRTISAISLNITGDTLSDEFAELPLTDEVAVFVPGNSLTEGYVTQLAKNVKEAAYAVEFFGPNNHVNGDTISLPTSPVDGYSYSRDELIYIWQWKDTGNPIIRLYGWGGSIDATGLVNMFVFHVGDGGPIAQDSAGASIDVITIACRSQVTNASTAALAANNGNPPTDVASMAFGGQGGYTINGSS